MPPLNNQIPQSDTVPPPQSEKSGSALLVVMGVALLLGGAGIAYVGFIMTAFSAAGGVKTAFITLAVVLVIVLSVAFAGLYLILKGLRTKVSVTPKDGESKIKYSSRVLAYSIGALILSYISFQIADRLILKFLYHGEMRINIFSPIAAIIGTIIYYSILNKKSALLKRIKLIILTFLVIYLIIPVMPTIGFQYLATGKLPTPSEYRRVERENDYIRNLFIEDTSSYMIKNHGPLSVYLPNSEGVINSYQAQTFSKNSGTPLTYLYIHITQTASTTFSDLEKKDLFGFSPEKYGGARYALELDGQKVMVDESDSEPSRMITDIKWISKNNYIEISHFSKFEPNKDEIVRAMLQKYPTTWLPSEI